MAMMKVIEPDGTPGVRRVDYVERDNGIAYEWPVMAANEDCVWSIGSLVPHVVVMYPADDPPASPFNWD